MRYSDTRGAGLDNYRRERTEAYVDDVRGRKTLVSKEHGCKKGSSSAGSTHTRRKTGQTDQGSPLRVSGNRCYSKRSSRTYLQLPSPCPTAFSRKSAKGKDGACGNQLRCPCTAQTPSGSSPPGCCRFAALSTTSDSHFS